MTPKQKALARHALGLDQTYERRSYRNRFFVGKGMCGFEVWQEIVKAGYALRYSDFAGSGDLFKLTREGADLALNPGESLCPEDFPVTP